ncbi:MAG: hypothetical protein AB4042_10480 [Leptolyngbyaceae cyanobacterium]
MNHPVTYDLVLLHPTVLTAEPDRPLINDAFIAIQNDTITVLTEFSDQPQGWQAQRQIDLTGHVITPGFVNVHTHTILSMVRGVAED